MISKQITLVHHRKIRILQMKRGLNTMSGKKIPQYKLIENELANQIHIGDYKKDDIIPTEMELAKKYGVSRVTVRTALDNLVQLGMLRRVPGVGTFVQEPTTREKYPQIMGFTKEILSMGMTPRTIVTDFQVRPVSANIARILELRPGAPIYYFTRQRYAGEELFVLETSYMSAELYPEISLQILQGSKYEYFENVRGEKLDRNEHTVMAIHPSAEVAALFHITENTPIIKLANISRLVNGRVLDYTVQMQSPKFQLHYIKQ